jgi:hypothetical protein
MKLKEKSVNLFVCLTILLCLSFIGAGIVYLVLFSFLHFGYSDFIPLWWKCFKSAIFIEGLASLAKGEPVLLFKR